MMTEQELAFYIAVFEYQIAMQEWANRRISSQLGPSALAASEPTDDE